MAFTIKGTITVQVYDAQLIVGGKTFQLQDDRSRETGGDDLCA